MGLIRKSTLLTIAKLGLVKKKRRKKEIEILIYRILGFIYQIPKLISRDLKSHFSGAMLFIN
jgi:hypothetical protein